MITQHNKGRSRLKPGSDDRGVGWGTGLDGDLARHVHRPLLFAHGVHPQEVVCAWETLVEHTAPLPCWQLYLALLLRFNIDLCHID